MNEPAQSITQPLGAALGGLLASPALLFGPHPEVFLIALFCSLFSAIWTTKVDSRWKAGAAVLFATLLAGFASVLGAKVAAFCYAPLGEDIDTLRIVIAILLAGLIPPVFPTVIEAAKGRAKKEMGGA